MTTETEIIQAEEISRLWRKLHKQEDVINAAIAFLLAKGMVDDALNDLRNAVINLKGPNNES